MRKIVVIALLTCATACTSSTSPDPNVISVRLRDDGGGPAGRNRIVITQTDGTKLTATTGTDGKANVSVPQPGEYVVSVIPRNSFVSSNALTRGVSVASNTPTVLEFILYRGGVSSSEPPPERSGW